MIDPHARYCLHEGDILGQFSNSYTLCNTGSSINSPRVPTSDTSPRYGKIPAERAGIFAILKRHCIRSSIPLLSNSIFNRFFISPNTPRNSGTFATALSAYIGIKSGLS